MSSARAEATSLRPSNLNTSFMRTRMGFCKARFPDLHASMVLDVGCGDGKHLAHFGPGSVGLDGRRLANADGYRFLQWSFDTDASKLLADNGIAPFRYVWCSDVFEHHPSPHLFLLDLRRCLDPDGVLLLGVPLVNPIGALSWSGRSRVLNYFRGYLSQDHVNFFSFKALKYTVEYCGFEVLDWYSPFVPFRRPYMSGLEPITVLALRAVPGYQYGPKAFKRLDDDGYLRWKSLSDYTTREVPRD
jgi:SAM-dependent methyltransferase